MDELILVREMANYIMSILEECERKNIPVTRKEIEQLGMD